MKAIVNSMDLKAVEPGLHARAAKPGGTALFDPLFAMTSAPVSDETSMAAEVGAEVLPDDPQTPSASWLVEVGAANPAPGFTVPAAQSMDPKVVQAALAAAVPTKTDTTLENGQLSGEATPLSWLVYEQQAAASGQKGGGPCRATCRWGCGRAVAGHGDDACNTGTKPAARCYVTTGRAAL